MNAINGRKTKLSWNFVRPSKELPPAERAAESDELDKYHSLKQASALGGEQKFSFQDPAHLAG